MLQCSNLATNSTRVSHLLARSLFPLTQCEPDRSFFNLRPKPDWDRAVDEAEKIVGYPTSFGNLRWLMSDEVANVALHLRKLVGTDHPILKIAKDLLHSGKNNLQAWGLMVLLVSKAAGHTAEAKKMEMVEGGGILQHQRIYAEITEIIKTGHMVHKGLINVLDSEYVDKRQNMIFGNKIALLTGDFLLATANKMLSDLRNSHLSALISSALRDLTESEFVGERDLQNKPLPSKPTESTPEPFVDIKTDAPTQELISNNRKCSSIDTTGCIGVPHREWAMRNILNGGSLLGRGCEGALLLGGHSEDLQNLGYSFGCQVALAWQASKDLKAFESGGAEPFSLVCAPLLFAMQADPTLYEEVKYAKEGKGTVDYNALRTAVKSGPALEKTMSLYHEYSKAAVLALENFPNTDATNALRKIVFSMR